MNTVENLQYFGDFQIVDNKFQYQLKVSTICSTKPERKCPKNTCCVSELSNLNIKRYSDSILYTFSVGNGLSYDLFQNSLKIVRLSKRCYKDENFDMRSE